MDSSRKKTVVVTGGAGFIGSHLCEYLLAKGNYVICVDNFFTGRKENIKHLLSNPDFELMRHDITNPLYVECDQIYNLACPAAPVHYQYNPIKTIKCSTDGMINMLGLAKRTKARILQASTSEVYGNPLMHPQKEEYWGNVNPIGIRSCFAADTEVLTADSWKLISAVTFKDKVLTLDKNKQLVYQKPTDIIKERYQGELIRFKNFQCDLSVTPNHKMYVQRRDDAKRADFELLPAFEAINWDRSHMLKVASWDAPDQHWFSFPAGIDRKNSKTPAVERITMDDWLEFFGYYITEGCVSIRTRERSVNGKVYSIKDYRVLIAQNKKSDRYQKIKRCLQRLPFAFVESFDHQLCITNKQLAHYLKRFGKSHEKWIPQELLSCSKRQLKILFDAMMLGDGSARGDTYYTNSYRLASNFQELLLKVGYAGNISAHDKRKQRILYDIHILNRFNKKYERPTYPARTIEKYDGLVYCVTVPHHVLFVRCNGKALFCGNCYDEGKRVAEALCMDYHRKECVDIRIVRIFNTYGPRLAINDGRVVSNFIVQALKNEPLTVYGDGSATRSFCYVADLVEGMYRMMNAEDFFGPVNLGNPNEFTVLELAKKVIALAGSSSAITSKPLPSDDPERRKPDISLAKEKLGWEPNVSVDEGLQKTIEYFRNVLS